MKNILLISGGGRPHGNTAQLTDAFLRSAEEAGNRTERVSLLETKVEPCLGCNACRRSKPCALKDGFGEIVPRLQWADMLALASPLYYWTISSRLKGFLERLYGIAAYDPALPLVRYEKYPDKDCALLMTAADNYFWTFQQVESYYRFSVVNYLGFQDKRMLFADGCGGAEARPAIGKTGWLDKAHEFGRTFYR